MHLIMRNRLDFAIHWKKTCTTTTTTTYDYAYGYVRLTTDSKISCLAFYFVWLLLSYDNYDKLRFQFKWIHFKGLFHLNALMCVFFTFASSCNGLKTTLTFKNGERERERKRNEIDCLRKCKCTAHLIVIIKVHSMTISSSSIINYVYFRSIVWLW